MQHYGSYVQLKKTHHLSPHQCFLNRYHKGMSSVTGIIIKGLKSYPHSSSSQSFWTTLLNITPRKLRHLIYSRLSSRPSFKDTFNLSQETASVILVTALGFMSAPFQLCESYSVFLSPQPTHLMTGSICVPSSCQHSPVRSARVFLWFQQAVTSRSW